MQGWTCVHFGSVKEHAPGILKIFASLFFRYHGEKGGVFSIPSKSIPAVQSGNHDKQSRGSACNLYSL
jgi:hypothetical protein